MGRDEKRAFPKTRAWEAMCTGEKEKTVTKASLHTFRLVAAPSLS